MLHKEFEERTGIQVSDEAYKKIDALYMATTLTKDEFCDHYVPTMSENPIVDSLRNVVDVYRKAYDNNQQDINNLRESLSNALKLQDELATFIADMAHLAFNAIGNGAELRKKAIEVLGKREYIKYIITKGYELEQYDKEDILKLLDK